MRDGETGAQRIRKISRCKKISAEAKVHNCDAIVQALEKRSNWKKRTKHWAEEKMVAVLERNEANKKDLE
jgi:hypothetical protein